MVQGMEKPLQSRVTRSLRMGIRTTREPLKVPEMRGMFFFGLFYFVLIQCVKVV